jgi:hypothetical protein
MLQNGFRQGPTPSNVPFCPRFFCGKLREIVLDTIARVPGPGNALSLPEWEYADETTVRSDGGVTMVCGWGCGERLTASEIRAHFTSCRKGPKK